MHVQHAIEVPFSDFHEIINSVKGIAFKQETPSGLSLSAVFAHLSFWDDWIAKRWERFLTYGQFEGFPNDLTELINAVGVRCW